MKSSQLLIIAMILLLNTNIKGQTSTITFSVISTPESCTLCCDGTIQVVNIQGYCTAPILISLMPTGQSSGNGVFQNLCSTNYTVSVEDPCGSVTSNTTCVDFNCPMTTGISENTINNNIRFDFLNNIVIVDNITTNTNINITDVSGKSVIRFILNEGKNKLDISNLSNGLYLVNLLQDDKIQTRIKIIKN